jgi:hypothetical protein
VYLDNSDVSVTNLTIFSLKTNPSNSLNTIAFNLSGIWTILSQNDKCLLLYNGVANNITLFKVNQANNTYQKLADLSSIIAN